MSATKTYTQTEAEFKKLAQAIQYYLSYVTLVTQSSKNNFVSESTIRYPLAEYIERRFENVETLELEHSYPFFKKRRCDIYIENKTDNEKKFKSVFFVELKYARQTSDMQDYFDDLLRLFFAIEQNPSQNEIRAFFIVCGNAVNFPYVFRHRQTKNDYNTEPTNSPDRKKELPFCNWLSFDEASPTMTLETSKNQKEWEIFQDDYKPQGFDFKQNYKFETQLLKYVKSSIDGDGIVDVAVWEIKKVTN